MTNQNSFATQTENYLNACRKNFDRIEVDSENTVHVKDIFVMLQAIESAKVHGAKKRSDLPELSDRLEKAGIVLEKSKEVGSEQNRNEQRILPINKALLESQHLALLGEPGSGKSTVLKYVAYCFATDEMAKLELGFVEARIPILINLQKYAPLLAQPGAILEHMLALEVAEIVQSDSESRQMVSSWREDGKLIILMDGLDEVSGDLRGKVEDQIAKFINSPMAQQCRVILASRTAGFSTPTESLVEFTIRPIDNDEEVIIYFQHWMSVLRGELTPEERSKLSTSLLEEMKQHYALRLVLDNPLLLRLSLQVYLDKKSVATNRTNLYDLWIENLWEKYIKRGGKPEDKNKIMQTLEAVAWQLQNNFEIQASEEINSLREKLGLLARYSNIIVFSHRTIQEYFVAKRLIRLYNENEDSFWAYMKTRLHIPGWREPIFLLFGGLSKQQRIAFVRKVLRAKSIYEDLLCRDLGLSLRLLNETDTLFVGLGQKLIKKSVRSRNPVERKIVAERLGDTRDSKSIEYLLPRLNDADKDVVEETVRSLGKIRDERAIPALLELNKSAKFDLSWSIERTIFHISGAKAIQATIESRRSNIGYSHISFDEIKDVDALISSLPSLDSFGRSQVAYSLGKIKGEKAYDALVELLYDNDPEVREKAAEALGELGNPNGITAILDSANNFELQYEHASALEKLAKEEHLDVFRKILSSGDTKLAWISIMVLENLKDYKSGSVILEVLNSPESDHNAKAFGISALGKFKYKPALPKLLEIVGRDLHKIYGKEYQDLSSLRRWAVEALGDIGEPEVLPALLKALNEESISGIYRFSKEAANALAKIGDTSVIPELIRHLGEIEMLMSNDVFIFLAQKCSADYLVANFDNPNRSHRANIISVLVKKADPGAEIIIEKALHDPDYFVRSESLTLADTINSKRKNEYFRIGLQDKEMLVADHVIKLIMKSGEVNLLSRVARFLDSRSYLLRQSAARTLVNISNEMAKSCGNDSEKKHEALKWLRFSAKELAKRHKKYNMGWYLEWVVEYITTLSVLYTDPFIVKPIPWWKEYGRRALNWFLWTLLIGLGGVFAIVFAASQDIFGELIKPWLQTLTIVRFVIVIFSLSILAGLIGLATDWLKSKSES